jgi:hypothetical protein
MNPDTEKTLRRRLKIAGCKAETLAMEAEEVKLPEDIPAWLDNSNQQVAALPDGLPQKAYLNELIERARKQNERAEYGLLKATVLLISRNCDNAQHDKWVIGVQNQFGKNADHRAELIQEEREPVWDSWKEEAGH